ncbi:AgrD family cyclic lactone autoinducer peptide [Listeria costaricensis]|uniref:AgrD family cyclic lactone autoinducer peptide n=1 Tax=Listeria costaricensis TaxID=2026604 RepID=UPI000C06976F|nr:cyclic lactone autoinducer peptide [Listeria costaricensis]
MRFTSKKLTNFVSEKIEKQSMRIADKSNKSSCVLLTYEPKSPFVKMNDNK